MAAAANGSSNLVTLGISNCVNQCTIFSGHSVCLCLVSCEVDVMEMNG